MPFISNTDEQRKAMLEACGVKEFKELIPTIPEKFVLTEECCLDAPLSELEITKKVTALAAKNATDFNSFLGAGLYDHFIPAAVDHIMLKPEFHTAYTPYQAEVSQGTLQYIYEYQSLICELTGMDISNAGLYDGASAAAEAVLMAVRKTKKTTALLAATLHPSYKKVIKSYTENQHITLIEVPMKHGQIDTTALEAMVHDDIACVVVQSPNIYGILEDMFAVDRIVHSHKKTLFISVTNPISLALYNAPSEYHSDIAVGEGQALGNSQNYGGPLFGFMATTKALTRSMPGRIVGATTDVDGKRGYVLTLQAREQHIRREKATSNICTSDQLCSLAATVYLSLMGPKGLHEVATQCVTKAHYLAEQLSAIDGFNLTYDQPFFMEFALTTPIPAREIITQLKEKHIFPGVDGARFGNENMLLIAVTEKKTKAEIDALITALKEVHNG